MRARRIGVGRFALRDVAARFEVERGRFRFIDIEVWSAPTRLSVDHFEVDLSQSPYRYRLELVASAVDLGQLLGAPGSLGPADVELRGGGEGAGLAGAVAEISLEIDRGVLPAVAPLARLDTALGTAFVGAEHDALPAAVALAAAELAIEPCELVTPAGRIELAGRAALDGGLALSVMVAVPPGTGRFGELPNPVAEVLADRDGWIRLPLRLSGSWDRPVIAVDRDALARLVGRRGSVGRPSEESLVSQLERWLGTPVAASRQKNDRPP